MNEVLINNIKQNSHNKEDYKIHFWFYLFQVLVIGQLILFSNGFSFNPYHNCIFKCEILHIIYVLNMEKCYIY